MFLRAVFSLLMFFQLSVDGNPLSYNDHSKEFLRSLNKMVGSEGKTAAIVALFSEVVPTAVQFSQILSSVVDYHLQSGTPLTSNFDALVADALSTWFLFRRYKASCS